MRENYYKKIKNMNGLELYDYGSINWNDFKPRREMAEYYVDSYTKNRPYVIASNVYGSSDYWDIICWLNGVKDPLNIKEGAVLKIPDLRDISDFLYTQKHK